jgi:hypothetical protein
MFQTPRPQPLALALTPTLLFRTQRESADLEFFEMDSVTVSKFLVEMSFSCFLPVKHGHKDMRVEQKGKSIDQLL